MSFVPSREGDKYVVRSPKDGSIVKVFDYTEYEAAKALAFELETQASQNRPRVLRSDS